MPKAIIVGAGITGLSAARVLIAAGWNVRILDKGRIAGGRFATRWLSNRTRPIDMGAQFITTRNPLFADAVALWESHGWVKRWCHGIPLLTATDFTNCDDGFPRFIGTEGMRALARHLAAGMEVQVPATLTDIAWKQNGWTVSWITGDAIRGTASGPVVAEHADALILTQPAPQVLHLLSAAGLPLPTGLSTIRYDPCFAVMVDLPQQAEQILSAPGAVRIEDPVSPLMWVASARGRGLVTSGDILLLHAGGAWSTAHMDQSTEQNVIELMRAARPTLLRLGVARNLPHLHTAGHMWRYSRCMKTCPEPFLRVDRPAPLLIAGDGFGDCPRVEGAWASGHAAAVAIRDATSA